MQVLPCLEIRGLQLKVRLKKKNLRKPGCRLGNRDGLEIRDGQMTRRTDLGDGMVKRLMER